MLQKTQGVVLKAVKYGDTSLIVSVFTRLYGVQSYMVQGVRSTKQKQNRSGLLQPATLLDLVVYQKPQQNLQRIKEFQLAHVYTSVHEEIIKNSIALFSAEVLLRLLPEHASMPEAFDFSFSYMKSLDELPVADIANFPVYFIAGISKLLGYDIGGNYSSQTPYIHLQDGVFTTDPPVNGPFLTDAEVRTLAQLMKITDVSELKNIGISSQMRFNMLDWYLEFLHRHTQHMGTIKSLQILRTILH